MKNPHLVRRLNILLRFGFFATGIATVLIGQILPIFVKKLEINDRQAGYFFIFQFAGSLAGTIISNWFGRRNEFIMAAVLGCLLIACGILFLNFDSYAWCLFGFFLNGLGIGFTLPSINMLTLELNPKGAASVLNTLNFFWGVGAISSQPFVDIFTRGTSILIPTSILAAMLFAVAVALWLTPREIEQKHSKRVEISDHSTATTTAAVLPPIWTSSVAWMIAAFNFIHVGFESGMGGWLKTYTARMESTAGAEASTTVLFPPILLYFIFFVIGRGAAPGILRFLDENRMLFFNLLIVLLGTVILLCAQDVWLLSIGASTAGFGTSSIFPTNVSRFTKTFGATATRRATPLFLCGTLGAAFTTWIIGFASNYFSDLRSGMFVLLTASLTLIVLQTFLMFRKKPFDFGF